MISVIYKHYGTIALDIDKMQGMLKIWLNDNIKNEWKFTEVCHVFSAGTHTLYNIEFQEEYDAMAFKLRWM